MKKTVAILLCSIMVLSFAGCAKKEAPAPETVPETAAATEAPTEAAAEASAEAATEAPTEAETEAPAPAATSDIASKIPEKVELIHPVVVTVHQGAQDDENKMIYTAEWGGAQLDKDEQQLYPQLAAALDEQIEASKQGIINLRNEIVKNNLPDMAKNEGFNGFEFKENYQIVRSDSAFTSVKTLAFSYTGGAHPNSGIAGNTYSTQDGTKIRLSDIFADEAAVLNTIHDRLKEDYPDAGFFNLDEDIKMYKFDAGENDVKLTWTLGYNGVTFYFNPYELAPYASGIQTVTLSFRDYPDLYVKGVDCYNGDYMTPILTDTKNPFGDGTVTIEGIYDQYGYANKLVITVNGNRSEFEGRTYTIDPYLAYKDGKYSVYVFESGDDDERWCDKYDIVDGAAVAVERIKGGIPLSDSVADVDEPMEGYHNYQRVHINYVPVDPNNLQISEK